MFERYTEKARRVIFFGRYEASQFGSPYIEAEHLLLGLLREDKALTNRFLRSPHASIESIRKQIEGRTTVREKVSTSVDLPLSQEGKRVLVYAAEEAERLAHKHIGTEHLLLGILREEKSFAAEILQERGLRLSTIREELGKTPIESTAPGAPKTPSAPKEGSLLLEFSRDLTQAAMDNELDPLIGRESELERVAQVLCRRTRNNPVLIGEPGVGKAAIIKGLAQRIADGNAPSPLAGKRILALHLSSLLAYGRQSGHVEELHKTILKELVKKELIVAHSIFKTIIQELIETQNAIVFVEELFAPADAEGSLDAANILKPALSLGQIQCISAATAAGYRQSVEKEPWLERSFHVVNVPPPGPADAIKILAGIKDRYQEFHGVTYTDDALKYAVYYSERYLTERYLPDKAIDLIDEAGTRVKLRQKALPEEMLDVQNRLKSVVHRMENAIANHEFEKARFYSDEERKEREKLRVLREKYQIDETATGAVTREDMEEVVASWTGVPAATLRQDSAAEGEDDKAP